MFCRIDDRRIRSWRIRNYFTNPFPVTNSSLSSSFPENRLPKPARPLLKSAQVRQTFNFTNSARGINSKKLDFFVHFPKLLLFIKWQSFLKFMPYTELVKLWQYCTKCLSICPSACLTGFLSVCVSACRSACCLSVCICIYRFVCLSVCLLPATLFVFGCVCLSVCVSLGLSVWCLPVCLSVQLSLCLSRQLNIRGFLQKFQTDKSSHCIRVNGNLNR